MSSVTFKSHNRLANPQPGFLLMFELLPCKTCHVPRNQEASMHCKVLDIRAQLIPPKDHTSRVSTVIEVKLIL